MLVDLGASGYTIVRTPYAFSQLDIEGLDGIRDLSFNPERGTGQGDIVSPFTWLTHFDVLLTALDHHPHRYTNSCSKAQTPLSTPRGLLATRMTSNSLPRLCLGYRTPQL